MHASGMTTTTNTTTSSTCSRNGSALRVAAGCVVVAVALVSMTGAASASRSPSLHSTSATAMAIDVYVSDGNGGLKTPDWTTTPPDAQLFSQAGAVLPATWGSYSAASATAVARSKATDHLGQVTDFEVSMTGLIPNGVYSIFVRTYNPDSVNSQCPSVDFTTALRAKHFHAGDPTAFTARRDGQAHFAGRVAGNVLDADQVQLVIIYHADGQTYGAVPNHGEAIGCRPSFSSDAFRHVLVIVK